MKFFNFEHFFTAYTDPDILIELVYMIVPWLVVSILASIFLDMFANVDFRNALGNKLGLGTLGCEDNDKKFLWACKHGYDKSVTLMLETSDSTVLNKKNADKSGLHIACDNKQIEVIKVLTEHPSVNINVKFGKDAKNALHCCRHSHYT